ncbi:hypothetical protein DFS34DRAFT_602959 [Phlyctochytrium arcticum]|nr:hypothetical protein DFS34DRAFT_602959 [Phlyctochytrium arcticum]
MQTIMINNTSSIGFCGTGEDWLSVISAARSADLTTCFEDIFLGSVPFIIFGIINGLALCKHWRKTPSSAALEQDVRNGTKVLVILESLLLALLTAIPVFAISLGLPKSAFYAAVIQAIAQVTALVLRGEDSGMGRSPRASIVFFYIWKAMYASITLRTYWLMDRPIDQLTALHATTIALVLLWLVVEETWAAPQGPTPRESAGVLGTLTFSYIWSTLRIARQRKVTNEDIWSCPNDINTDACSGRLHDKLPKLGKVPVSGPVLMVALIRSEWKMFGSSIMLSIIKVALVLAQPLLLDRLMTFVASQNGPTPQPANVGYTLAIAMFIIGILTSFCTIWEGHISWGLYYRWKYAISSAVFRKSLSLSNSVRGSYPASTVTNLISNDAMEVGFIAAQLPAVAHILEIFFAVALLWIHLGWFAFVAVVCTILLVPAHILNAKVMGEWMDRKFSEMDKRTSLTSEVLNSIKVIKMYAWENQFVQQIMKIRETELGCLFRSRLGDAMAGVIGNLPPVVMFAATISLYARFGAGPDGLDVNTVFVSFALFTLLKSPLYQLSFILPSVAVSFASLGRVVKFLSEPESMDYVLNASDQGAVSVLAGTLSWARDTPVSDDASESTPLLPTSWGEPTTKQAVLSDISLQVLPGHFIGVIGKVGSGKSSLLAALLGHLELVSGEVRRQGSLAYVPQKAWITGASIRDNILMGRPFDRKRYDAVVAACALVRDFELMPSGDATDAGERGNMLSEGQKQRVSIARAVYAPADIYLFDDMFSAVDRHVAQHLYTQVLGPRGITAGATRILVTHAVERVEDAHQVVVLKEGKIATIGTWAQVKGHGAVKEISAEIVPSIDEEKDTKKTSAKTIDQVDIIPELSSDAHSPDTVANDEKEQDDESLGMTMNWKALSFYVKNTSIPLAATFFIAMVSAEGANLASRFWLRHWSEKGQESLGFDLGVYVALICAYVVLFTTACATFLCKVSIQGSRNLHSALLEKVLTRLSWPVLSRIPVGQFMTRFGENLGGVDVGLPDALYDMIFALISIVTNVLPMIVSAPPFIVIVVLSAIFCYILYHLYIPASIQFTRIRYSSSAGIWSHVDETLDGLASVKAYQLGEAAIHRNAKLMDAQHAGMLMSFYTTRWFAFWLMNISAFLIFASSLTAVFSVKYMSAASVGLAISTILAIVEEVSMMMNQLGRLQGELVSAARIMEHLELPDATSPVGKHPAALSPTWPSKGPRIDFKNVVLRYAPTAPPVLQSLSLTIPAGQTLGIVGRTGAGKSSLALALLRLVELDQADSGSIEIDGVDIATVPSNYLRNIISVIPQDATLFAETVRFNLDPSLQHSDAVLWQVLSKVHLKDHVARLQGGLDATMATNGSDTFSVGQKQLINLARALLRPTSILLLDEATASVDSGTDTMLQSLLKAECVGRTVLIIAHRVDTVMGCNAVIVMEGGRIIEHGPPLDLVANKTSQFSQLVNAAKTNGL